MMCWCLDSTVLIVQISVVLVLWLGQISEPFKLWLLLKEYVPVRSLTIKDRVPITIALISPFQDISLQWTSTGLAATMCGNWIIISVFSQPRANAS